MIQDEHDQSHLSVVVPDSPSDGSMNVDAQGNPLAIAVGDESMQPSDARDDPQQPRDDRRTHELEAQVASLRQELHQEKVLGQIQAQEVDAHLRGQARQALDYQRDEFINVAKRHEQVSADATEAAVFRERSDQQAAQHQQLDAYRRTLSEVEVSVQQREYMLRQAMSSHQEALHGQLSQ